MQHDAAREALKEMRTPLCKVLGLQSVEEPMLKQEFISLPLPPQSIEDPVHLTMISTYLIQALAMICLTVSTADEIEELARILMSPNSHCVYSWLPLFQPMQAKQVDSLLTRAYTSITKACTNRPSSKGKASLPSPESTYLLRGYALKCLVSASPGTVEPDAFWDQLVRFTGSFARSCAEAKDETAGSHLILSTFETVVQSAEARSDASTFLDGTKFLAFCDYWITFAKRVSRTVVCIAHLTHIVSDRGHRSVGSHHELDEAHTVVFQHGHRASGREEGV
jgi:separase